MIMVFAFIYLTDTIHNEITIVTIMFSTFLLELACLGTASWPGLACLASLAGLAGSAGLAWLPLACLASLAGLP